MLNIKKSGRLLEEFRLINFSWKTLLYVDRKSIDDIPAKKIMNDFFHNQPSAFLQKFHRKTHC